MKSLAAKYGQNAVVTGATSRMGKVFAQELARQGMDVLYTKL